MSAVQQSTFPPPPNEIGHMDAVMDEQATSPPSLHSRRSTQQGRLSCTARSTWVRSEQRRDVSWRWEGDYRGDWRLITHVKEEGVLRLHVPV